MSGSSRGCAPTRTQSWYLSVESQEGLPVPNSDGQSSGRRAEHHLYFPLHNHETWLGSWHHLCHARVCALLCHTCNGKKENVKLLFLLARSQQNPFPSLTLRVSDISLWSSEEALAKRATSSSSEKLASLVAWLQLHSVLLSRQC